MSDDDFEKRPFSGPSSTINNFDDLAPAVPSDVSNSATIDVILDNLAKPSTSQSCFICPECQKSYKRHCSLKHHVSQVHPSKLGLIKSQKLAIKTFKYKCSTCHHQFNKKHHLQYHERTQHTPLKEIKKKPIQKCTLCNHDFPKKDILDHIRFQHGLQIEAEDLEFSSFTDFNAWKEKMEQTTKSKFRQERGARSSGVHIIHYFVCHRSGYFTSKCQGPRLRYLKMSGSNKINGFCTASIKIVENKDGKCSVHFVRTHIGHQCEIGHLFLSSLERESMAEKIAMKLPFDSILDDIRDSVSGSGLERLHLLTKKDLYNIENSFNLQSTAVRHKDDGISVEAWINEMRSSDDPCVLFYKPQGVINEKYHQLKSDDFMLIIMNQAQSEILQMFGKDCICMDGTHGLNGYGFELITLLTIDDMRQGFPCAFFISNRTDQEALVIFLSHVKDRVGSISSKIFMSDMADSLFNSWFHVMGMPELRLYCSWHVDRAWRKNLKKVKGKEKQKDVYENLRTVLQELDRSAFDEMMKNMVKNWLNDPDTVEFAKYFTDHYAKCASFWAYCCRLHCGLNTNMHIERMHKTLKYIYLHGKTVKRLDKSIHALMKFVRDRLFDRLIIIYKGKISSKLQCLRQRHKASQLLSPDMVIKNENGWNVPSSNSYEFYFIEEIKNHCTCKITCTYCDSCIHRYTCTCIDSAIKWNMCKHIHLVCCYRKENEVLASSESKSSPEINDNLCIDINERNIVESDALIAQLSKTSVHTLSTSVQARRELLKQNLIKLTDSLKTIEEIEIIEKMYISGKSTVTASRVITGKIFQPTADSAETPISVSTNKNILQQRRLFSTKKVRKTQANSLAKPTVEKSQSIALSLLLNREQNTIIQPTSPSSSAITTTKPPSIGHSIPHML